MKLSEVNDYLGRVVSILGEYGQGHSVNVKDLPQSIRDVLKTLKYHRREIVVIPQERVVLGSSGGNGYRAFVAIVNVETGIHRIERGSWGGPNMFSKSNAVDNDNTPHAIPENGAVIIGNEGGGRPVYATIYVNPSMISGFLPVEKDVVSAREKRIIAVVRSYTGTDRDREFSMMGVKQNEVDELIRRQLLGRTAKGSVTITNRGKAVGRYGR